MRIKSYELIPLKWDTDYFGISSARVNLNGIIDHDGQREIITTCKDFDFITIYNFGNIPDNNHWLSSKTKAFLADMNIQFVKVLTYKPDYQDENTYIANSISRNQHIADIAQKSFTFSRFFNDPKLPKIEAKNIYLHWTECAFGKKNKYFVISEIEGIVAGYIVFSIRDESCILELIAVDEKHQGKRIGKSLICKLESYLVENGISTITVGTQVNNISAFQFYTKMGFRYVNCCSVYHLWTC